MKYSKRFVTLFEQDEPIAQDQVIDSTPQDDREAMAGTLDRGVTADQYDVPSPAPKQDVIKQEQVQELKMWISKIDEFVEYLNAPSAESIQTKLHSAQCDTMFSDIARSEKKKISRLAADLSTLSESLKGYLISSNA